MLIAKASFNKYGILFDTPKQDYIPLTATSGTFQLAGKMEKSNIATWKSKLLLTSRSFEIIIKTIYFYVTGRPKAKPYQRHIPAQLMLSLSLVVSLGEWASQRSAVQGDLKNMPKWLSNYCCYLLVHSVPCESIMPIIYLLKLK
jgi:hypothetical protein